MALKLIASHVKPCSYTLDTTLYTEIRKSWAVLDRSYMPVYFLMGGATDPFKLGRCRGHMKKQLLFFFWNGRDKQDSFPTKTIGKNIFLLEPFFLKP